MAVATIVKQYKHFCFLASGKFNERNFDQNLKDEEGEARHIQGKMTPQRVQLIISDAKRHKAEIEAKFPHIVASLNKEKGVNGSN